jgi:hypothetical protein
MSSLRRDLLERRLWPVVVLLLVAVIAVPLMLRKNARADVPPVPPPPPVAGAAAAGNHGAGRSSAPAPPASTPRDPFASATAGVNATPRSPASPASGASGTTATSTPTPATPAPVASTVSPPPAASSAGSPAAPTPTTATTTTSSTTSTVSSLPPTTPEAVRSWTVYGVAVRVGTGSFAPLRPDVARLTPLPSVAQPKAMFMGVMAGGRQAVFALGAGVQHTGPGVCRPDRKRCAAIVLRVGQTEQIIAPLAGGSRQLNLHLVSITARVTHSHDLALAAFRRHSAAGRCELALADPLAYSQSAGTLSPVAVAACKDQPAAVPFPGGLAAP